VFVTSRLTAEPAASVLVITSTFWEWEVSDGHYSSGRTYVEDLKDLVELQPPDSDLFLVVLCMEVSRNYVSVSLLGDIPFDLCHSPGVRRKTIVRLRYSKYAWMM